MSSRDMYGGSQRSPRAAQSSRDVMLGPPKTSYASISQPPSARGSPIARNLSSPSQGRRMRPTGPYGVSRSSNSSPLTMATHDYYGDEPDLRVSHRSRSATRAAPPAMRSSYPGVVDQDFMPIRDRSLERGATDIGGGGRRGGYRGEDMYRETTIDGDPYRDYGGSSGRGGGGSFVAELQSRLNELQSQYGSVKRELDATTQKLGSSMHSIKTFWSPELKKERALRKEEAAKYALINDQLKILRSENQKQASLIRQLEEELRMAHMRNPDAELRQHLDALYAEKEHMAKEIFLLRETIKELELRIETQKQTLASRDESIKKLMEMLQSKGVGGQMLDEQRMEMERLKSRLIESEARARHLETMLDTRDRDIGKCILEHGGVENNIVDAARTAGDGCATPEQWRSLSEELRTTYGNHITMMEAILDTKEARISILESEVDLLEKELEQRNRLTRAELNAHTPQLITGTDDGSLDELRIELNKRDQELLAMGAKMKTLEEQHHDYQRHIAVLKESLCAKEEHYNMLQADVEELRQRLEEKNKLIEKKTQQALTATQERNHLSQELQELRDHMDIKDRKINVLQRKIENLEDLLKEKDNQVDMARARLSAIQAHHSTSEGALSSLEEAIGDKDKQIVQLREQRDRAEQERNEERDLHERQLAEYRMKMHALESEMDKLQSRLEKANAEKERLEARLENSQSELGQARAELDKIQAETEIQNLRAKGAQAQPKMDAEVEALKKRLDDRQKQLDEFEKRLKKKKEKLEQAEAAMQKAGTTETEQELVRQLAELKMRCAELETRQPPPPPTGGANEAELERLLQIMSSLEEEKVNLNAQIKQLQEALKDRESKLNAIKRSQQTDKTRSAQMMDEARRREGDLGREASKAQEEVTRQRERIEALEEALRESVEITAESEAEVVRQESLLREAHEKVADLEAQLCRARSSECVRCGSCPDLRFQMKDVGWKAMWAERKRHLDELYDMKLEALSAAISEKDAHLAILEEQPAQDENTRRQAESLRAEKERLVQRIKIENESRVRMIAEADDALQRVNGTGDSETVNEQNDMANNPT